MECGFMEALTSKNYDSVMKNKVVFVDFWASWCGPCRSFGPIFEDVAEKYSNNAKFVKCNVDDERNLAVKNGIMSIPCTIVFVDGKPVDKQIGLLNEQVFSAFVEKYIK